jgi:hypothetical protein
MQSGVSRSHAARKLGCSLRTVHRYCQREPGIIRNGKVDLDALKRAIAVFKFRDSRGFPLGHKRSDQKLPLDALEKPKPVIRRTLIQRLEIIRREIDAMTDAEQVQMLEMGVEALWNCFRRSSFERFIAKYTKGQADKAPG